MRKKIYTADEDLGYSVVYTILFTIIWYSGMVSSIVQNGFQPHLLIFLIGGLLPAAQSVSQIRKAIYFRNFHKKCMQEGYPQQGRIVNIRKDYYTEEVSNRRYQRLRYYLVVEIANPVNGTIMRITSEAYKIPVHHYLASPYVQVYTDSTGWKYVIDGFQLKRNKREPDIPLEDSNVYLKDFNQPSMFFKVIVVVIMILMILQVTGILK